MGEKERREGGREILTKRQRTVRFGQVTFSTISGHLSCVRRAFTVAPPTSFESPLLGMNQPMDPKVSAMLRAAALGNGSPKLLPFEEVFGLGVRE